MQGRPIVPDSAALIGELRATLGRLEIALGALPEGIVWADRQGRVKWCNKAFDELVGRPHIEVLGRGLAELLPVQPGAAAGEPHPASGWLVTLGAGHHRYRFADQEFEVEVRVALAGAGEVGNVILFHDVTDRERAAQALEKMVAELRRPTVDLERLAHRASQGLREPLGTILGLAQLLAQRYRGKLDAAADEAIAGIASAAEHATRLIDGVVAYSRLWTRRQELQPTRCDDVLEAALADLRTAIEDSGAIIARGDLPEVMADPDQLAVLFRSLIANAIELRGKDAPRIHISVRRAEQEWVFSFLDNGIGIDSAERDRIFEIFPRLPTEKEHPGAGVGLALAKGIVERHGGRIWVESEPGRGARFYFTLKAVADSP